MEMVYYLTLACDGVMALFMLVAMVASMEDEDKGVSLLSGLMVILYVVNICCIARMHPWLKWCL